MRKVILFKRVFLSFIFCAIVTLNLLYVSAGNGSLLEELDILENWKIENGCELSIDKDNKVSGVASLKVKSTSVLGGEAINLKTATLFNKDLSDLKNVEINIYVPDLNGIQAIALYIMTDDNNFYYNYIGKWELMKGWNIIRRVKSDFRAEGNPTWNSIKRYWIRAESQEKAKPVFNIDKISYNVTGDTKILLTFDDGLIGTYEYALPIMANKGMNGTVWVNKFFATGDSPKFMRPAQITDLYKAGWDIGNHTVNHKDDITKLSQAERISEYSGNMEWMLSNNWKRGYRHVCYPMGSHDDKLIKLLKKIGVKSARSTIYGMQSEPVEDLYRLRTIAVGRDTDVEVIKKNIDNAIITGSNIIFMFHNVSKNPAPNSVEEEIYVSEKKFEEIINYIQNKKEQGHLKVQTITQWYKDYKSKQSQNNWNVNLNELTEEIDDLPFIPTITIPNISSITIPNIPSITIPNISSITIPNIPSMTIPNIPSITIPNVINNNTLQTCPTSSSTTNSNGVISIDTQPTTTTSNSDGLSILEQQAIIQNLTREQSMKSFRDELDKLRSQLKVRVQLLQPLSTQHTSKVVTMQYIPTVVTTQPNTTSIISNFGNSLDLQKALDVKAYLSLTRW